MRHVRFGVAALAIACALAVLAVASATPSARGTYGGTLYVGMAVGEPSSLDPTLASTAGATEVFSTMCEGLYELNQNFQIIPQLASSLPVISPDKLTYTIQLRKGLLFNDGTPFNAQAVVTSLERDITLPGAVTAQRLAAVGTVTASGPSTVVIHLTSRYSPLVAVLAGNQGLVMSPTQLGKLGSNFGTDPICVGPFMYDNRVAGSSMTVIKSPFYYDKLAVHLDKIVFEIENDGAAAAAALKAGDLQALDSVAATEIPGLQQDSSVRVLQQKTIGFSYLIIDMGNKNGIGNLPYTNVGTPLASSPKLRQAFEEAIDRAAYVKVVAGGYAVPACADVSPVNTAWYTATKVPCTPYDLADAKKLVAASGFANPTVHLLTSNTTASLLAAQFIQSEEAAAGINVVIDATDFPTATAQAAAGNFDVFAVGNTGNIDPGLSISRLFGTSGPLNDGGYSNPRLDFVLANYFKATGVKAQQTLIHVAQEIVAADRPAIFLDFAIFTSAASTTVTGVHQVNGYFRTAFAQLR